MKEQEELLAVQTDVLAKARWPRSVPLSAVADAHESPRAHLKKTVLFSQGVA